MITKIRKTAKVGIILGIVSFFSAPIAFSFDYKNPDSLIGTSTVGYVEILYPSLSLLTSSYNTGHCFLELDLLFDKNEVGNIMNEKEFKEKITGNIVLYENNQLIYSGEFLHKQDGGHWFSTGEDSINLDKIGRVIYNEKVNVGVVHRAEVTIYYPQPFPEEFVVNSRHSIFCF